MDERQLREVFLERLHIEIQLFRDSLLQKAKADIYAASYRIELYVNIYEILVEQAGRMPGALIRGMAYHTGGILDAFYQGWLNEDDSFYTELRDYVEGQLEVALTSGTAYGRKEDGNGKGNDKAA